jgi:hypothetical protein
MEGNRRLLRIIEESNWPIHNHATTSSGQASEHAFMVNLRQEIANQMWEDRKTTMLPNLLLFFLL